jgi:hypothetical protein
VTDLRERADLLDEGLAVIRELLSGGRRYHGRRYRFDFERDDQIEIARPVQKPVPIWVVGVWPRPKSMRRVLRCDGIVPQYDLGGREGGPDDARALRGWLVEHGADPGIDVIAQGETPGDDPAAWAEAGCTWWLETRWELPHHVPERMQQIRERISAGPPRG